MYSDRGGISKVVFNRPSSWLSTRRTSAREGRGRHEQRDAALGPECDESPRGNILAKRRRGEMGSRADGGQGDESLEHGKAGAYTDAGAGAKGKVGVRLAQLGTARS